VPVEFPEDTLDQMQGTSVTEGTLFGAQKDPQPSRARVYAKAPSVKPKVSVAEKKDVKAKIAMLLLPPAAIWGRYDQYCGTAFAQVIPELSEDLVEIFADSAEIMAWFASGTGWMKYLKLLNTLQPVGEMIWAHHISHTVGEVNKDGYAPDANATDWDTRYIVPTQQQARTVPSADSLPRS
jgi:hypothetical protein